ncbi:MAG: hypothetical protein NTV80_20775 [Verrucomicrobia bacterium]|nr:hypothetical protein [Verrucomicrobiota bacterium]
MRTLTQSLEEDGREWQTRDWISSLEAPATGAQRFGELAQLALWLHSSGKVQPKAKRTSHQIKRLSHAPSKAMPLMINDPRE